MPSSTSKAGIFSALLLSAAVGAGGIYAGRSTAPTPPAPAPTPLPSATLTLPAMLSGEPGEWVTVQADSSTEAIEWDVAPRTPLITQRAEKSVTLEPRKPGVYLVTARVVSAAAIAKAQCTVTIAGTPVPPVPVPPGPAPPNPPAPNPPGPTDPFTASLQAAYTADTAADKAATKTNLAALYRQAANTATTDTTLLLWGGLWEKMAAAAQTLGVAGKLPAVQSLIAADEKTVFPVLRVAPLDQAGRATASKEFMKISTALEAVK